MTTTLPRPAAPPTDRHPGTARGPGRKLVGGFYLVMAGLNLGAYLADPQTYRPSPTTDSSVRTRRLAPDRDGHPTGWILMLVAGEVTFGTLLLVGGRAAKPRLGLRDSFHALLMLFGWWAWAYSVPALVLLDLPCAT